MSGGSRPLSVAAAVRVLHLAVLGSVYLGCGVPRGGENVDRGEVLDLLTAVQLEPQERTLAAKGVDIYQVLLGRDEVVRIVVEQRGADVALAVVDPEGREQIVVDRPIGAAGAERVSVLAARAGTYRLEVRNTAGEGRYLLRVVDGPRPAQPADRLRAEAEGRFVAARRLERQGGPEPIRAAAAGYRAAVDLARDARDRQLQAISLARHGECLDELDEQDAAAEAFRQALPMLVEVGEIYRAAEVYNSLGVIARRRGRFAAAREHYAEAELLAVEAGNEPAQIQVLGNRGTLQMYEGEVQQALDAFGEQRRRWHELGRPKEEVNTLNRIGELYTEVGEAQGAIDYLTEALALAQEHRYAFGGATALDRLGRAYLLRGEWAKAQDALQRALRLVEEQSYTRAGFLNNLGRVYRHQGRYEEALGVLEQAREIYTEKDARRDLPVVLMHLAWVREGMGEPDAALPLYEQARAGYRAVGDRSGEASTLYGAARAELKEGDLAAALRHVDRALVWVEERHRSFADPSLATSYLASKHDYFALKVEILMRLHEADPVAGHAERALETSELGRARALLESLFAAREGPRIATDTALMAERQAVWRKIRGLELALTDLRGTGDAGDASEDLDVQLRDLLAEDERIEARLRVANPRYAALTQPQAPDRETIQRRLLDDGTLLLVYSLGEERSYLWAIDRRGFTTHTLPGRDVVDREARRAYELVRNSQELRAARPAEYAAAKVAALLLGPVAERLGEDRLVIVADGALHYLPFAALPAPAGALGAGEPLIERHEVVSLPSIAVLGELRRTAAGRPPPAGQLAVLADPVFQPEDERLRPASGGPATPAESGSQAANLAELAGDLGIRGFTRLGFAHREAEAILALVPAGERFAALGLDASLDTVLTAPLGHYRCLHFATHGIINEKHPKLSGLVLSLFDRQGRPINGILRTADVYGLDLPVELVVLSACRTALGREVSGEGLIGLTRGFMYAGAPRVVVSLWDVNDRATAALMERFYRGLLYEGLRPAAALRAAQRSLRREDRWAAPFYWAGFVLQGEWR